MQILGLVSPYTGGHFDIDVFWGHFFGVDQAQVRCVISSPAPGHDVATHAAACAGCCHPLTRAETWHSGPIRGQDRQQPTNQRRGSCQPRALLASYRCPHLRYPAQSLCSVFSLSLSVSPWSLPSLPGPRYHSRPSNDRWLGTKSPISGHNLLSPDHLISQSQSPINGSRISQTWI